MQKLIDSQNQDAISILTQMLKREIKFGEEVVKEIKLLEKQEK